MKQSYFFWYWVYQAALKVESAATRLRDLAQRRKMNCVPKVHVFWLNIEGGW